MFLSLSFLNKTQQKFTCSNLTIETPEKVLRYVESYQ